MDRMEKTERMEMTKISKDIEKPFLSVKTGYVWFKKVPAGES